mgnify:CR=1 FL=1
MEKFLGKMLAYLFSTVLGLGLLWIVLLLLKAIIGLF